VAGAAGLATSYFAAMVLGVRSSPVVAVAEVVIKHTPGALAERAIQELGHKDKPVLVTVILIVLGVLFALVGRLARRAWWQALLLLAVIGAIGAYAASQQRNAGPQEYLPVLVGFVTWLVCLSILADNLRSAERRDGAGAAVGATSRRHGFLVGAGVMLAASIGVGVLGRALGAGRRRVEDARALLRLPGVTEPVPPDGVSVGLKGITPWESDAEGFYQVHTAIVPPAIEPTSWRLRIHGMVEKELTLTYEDLMARQVTEAWVTLNCVSNPVGGPLIGNAWWSGVRLADLLAEVGVSGDADAVLQTSDDGWTCGTPLSALTDGRDAMLVVAMNGEPLPIEHGFPVRTLVPGLYGYVSACKWVVEMEVTRFDKISAYWTERGWGEMGPVRTQSRIDVPRGDVKSGSRRIGGSAWAQHTGIERVEYRLDGDDWRQATLGRVPGADTWVQWAATVELDPGRHTLAVRATDRSGYTQTSVLRDVVPDGATGWHTVEFDAD
jgi:DMSO/TMAO reductase YedYZ molybdopterin-dependent catalytic subunit